MQGLKEKSIRGGLANVATQIVSMAVRLGYMVIMARLLDPEDFGLFAMVLAVTGIFDIFSSAGLWSVTVQREEISDQQISTLFWVNVLIGVVLAISCLATAPLIATLYNEPRLFPIAAALSGGFILTGAGVQHFALLQRDLRFITSAALVISAQSIAYIVSIAMALDGFGYWSLVAAAVTIPCLSTTFAWVAVRWTPGMPHINAEIASMLRSGGTITLNGLVVHIAYNFDKFLIGRFWGADALGIYGRAYQLVGIPTLAFNAATGAVAFSAFSRLQNDSSRLKSFFLKSYTLSASVAVPTTIFGALCTEDIIRFVLGPKWMDAVTIFRFLTPTILVFAIIQPVSSYHLATGRQVRSLYLAFAIASLVIVAYLIGLPYGPAGVALGFSGAMSLWVVPHVVWALHGTNISPSELFSAYWRPLVAGVIAGALLVAFEVSVGEIKPVLLSLLVKGCVLSVGYACLLIFAFGQKQFYLNLLGSVIPARFRSLSNRPPEA